MMSGGRVCTCSERRKSIDQRQWIVTMRHCHYSAFNGHLYTPSDYSEVLCLKCNKRWRTKAEYTDRLRSQKTEIRVAAPKETRLSQEQRSLLLGMQTMHPQKVLVCFRQRSGKWTGGVFMMGRYGWFYPRTMQSLWRRGLVQYHERLGGDRIYSLTEQGFTTPPG